MPSLSSCLAIQSVCNPHVCPIYTTDQVFNRHALFFFTSATERWDVWRVRGVDGRRPVPLQDLHPRVPWWLPEGAGLPACRGPAGDERYSPHCHWLELLLLCKSAQLTATITYWTTNMDVYQKIHHVDFRFTICFTGLWVIKEFFCIDLTIFLSPFQPVSHSRQWNDYLVLCYFV